MSGVSGAGRLSTYGAGMFLQMGRVVRSSGKQGRPLDHRQLQGSGSGQERQKKSQERVQSQLVSQLGACKTQSVAAASFLCEVGPDHERHRTAQMRVCEVAMIWAIFGHSRDTVAQIPGTSKRAKGSSNGLGFGVWVSCARQVGIPGFV